MIVLNNDETMNGADKMHEEKITLVELYRREIDAYCAYKEWMEETEDMTLAMGLEEIMYDEYLHAKFLRSYLIDRDMYTPIESDMHEQKFWKIHTKLNRK